MNSSTSFAGEPYRGLDSPTFRVELRVSGGGSEASMFSGGGDSSRPRPCKVNP